MSAISRRSFFTTVMLGGTLGAAAYTSHGRPDRLAEALDGIPREIDGWSSVDDPPLEEEVMTALRPTSYLSRHYSRRGQSLNLFVAYYSQQRSGESMHSPKHCLPGGGWEILEMSSVSVPANGGNVGINKFIIEKAGQKAAVLYWYQSRNRIIANEYAGKVLLIRDALVDGRTSGSIVRIVVEDKPEAIRNGAEFASRIIPRVNRCIGV